MVGFSYASLASNHDLTSQLGYVIFVNNMNGYIVPILYQWYRAHHESRLDMRAELIAFIGIFEVAPTRRRKSETLHLGKSVSLKLFTECKTLFDVISKGTPTSWKRLMLGIMCTRE